MKEPTGSWMKTLIPNSATWVQRKQGDTNYYPTEFLSDHGNFQNYLFRIRKTDSMNCRYYGDEGDFKPTFLEYGRGDQLRRRYLLEMEIMLS